MLLYYLLAIGRSRTCALIATVAAVVAVIYFHGVPPHVRGKFMTAVHTAYSKNLDDNLSDRNYMRQRYKACKKGDVDDERVGPLTRAAHWGTSTPATGTTSLTISTHLNFARYVFHVSCLAVLLAARHAELVVSCNANSIFLIYSYFTQA